MTFVLRREHEQAIADAIFARFLRFGVGVLRSRHPKAVAGWSDELLQERLSLWCTRARRWGFRTEKHFLRYARATIATGGVRADGPVFPGAQRILGDADREPDARSSELLHHALVSRAFAGGES